jgi:N-acetylmuramoyl-L-alanine amidase
MNYKKFAALAAIVIIATLLYRQAAFHSLRVFNFASARTVAIDPGHGNSDQGVVHEESGVTEGPINLAVAYKLKDMLSKQKYQVVLTRDKHTPQCEGNRRELQRRIDLATDAKADIFVSMHVNQFPDPQYFGAQCFYNPASPEGQKLAQLLQEELKAIDPENFREALDQDLFVLRECPMPAVVVEMGFISHPGDRAKLQDPKYQSQMAQAVSRGIDRYFKGDALKYTPGYN